MPSEVRLRAARVLVVDDNRMVAKVVSLVLGRYGVSVVQAHSYAAAASLTESYAVGVFDIDLGDGCGVTLATRLLAAGQVGAAVFYSGGAGDAQLARAHALGPVFSKGADPAALTRHVLAVLGLPLAATAPPPTSSATLAGRRR